MKKRIGISFTHTNFPYYWDWFTSEDLKDDIELVNLSFEKMNSDEILTCDGFILTGGVDVEPSLYGYSALYDNAPGTFQMERDFFEKEIFEYSQQQKLPLLGICRGMQLVNTLQGGKLIQDLGEHNKTHKREEADKQHEVKTERNTLMHEIAGTTMGSINSAHHQAIHKNELGKNLKPNAYSVSADGTIEGLEFEDKSDKGFMLCVQWHPERIEGKEQNPFSENIKKRFLQEIRKTNMEKLTLINPATEEVIATLNADTKESLGEKFKLMKKAQPGWAALTVKERVACIRKFVELLDAHKDGLARTLTDEMGKPLQQSYNELNGAKSRISFFMDHSEKWLAEEWVIREGATKEKIVYEPLGIIANISAWNYPYLVAVNVVIPALIGGNAVFYKPSEYTVLTGMHIRKLLRQSGVHEGCFELAIGKGNVGAALLELPLDGYYFTGSYKTGKYIAEQVVHKLVPCQLELGGKDPLYVMDDVEDIAQTAAAALEGVVYNNGQSCCAVERIYVQEKIYDAFVKSYVEQARKLKVGSPLEKDTDVGAVSRKEQVDFLLGQIEDAKAKGATVLYGGKALQGKGYFIKPAVLVNVNHDMRIMKEESFGPVVGIQKVKDDDEAVALMLDTEYGLTAAVYSKNYERAEKVMKKMNTGTVYWNCCDRVSGALPWSGRKHSGLGSTLSYHGIRAFVQPKAYHIRG
ncbi:MAG: aldehyde dehydrogenase family protein [Bacteroidetes bacterium]|nr:aldehyde dehydrogenase family protein [Bacteroidota bacterium]MBS1973734.1 aldehyde dehydrogenase family protein [Bacteroidota bacterium]